MTLWRYATGQSRIVVAPIAAARMRLADAAHYAEQARTLVRDENVSLDDLVAHLRRVGYESHDMVEMPGQFTVRGGIVDIFPAEAERPVRLELFGDSVESLREFDPNTQRSVRPIERVTLPPLVEQTGMAFGGGNGSASGSERAARGHSLFDLHEDTVILLDEPGMIEEASRAFLDGAAENLEASGSQSLEVLSSYYFTDDWDAQLARHPRLELEFLGLARETTETRTIQTQSTTRFHGDVPAFMEEARNRIAAGERVLLGAESLGELERFADLCHEYEVPFRLGELQENATSARLAEDSSAGSVPAVVLCRAPFTDGVVFLDARVAIFGTGDVFESMFQGATKRRPKTASFFSDFSELKPGDYVVHVDHGIGQFEGLQTIENDGARGEFMRLRYADDARLYVPLERMDLVQAYHSLEGAKPRSTGSAAATWTARKVAREESRSPTWPTSCWSCMPSAKRRHGFAFSPDTPWQREFEDAFEFAETPDQATAIADIKRDMEQPQPMDRLLCGDVGYGKTEVAMRAAFKARQRFQASGRAGADDGAGVPALRNFPPAHGRVSGEGRDAQPLSQRARAERQSWPASKTGKVDIVIGTHRLLSKDVQFHDLGLLIVDEEQRFGVAHKERLKEMSRNVDVLTLTATPIPRTLNMSLVGLRDMSRDRDAAQGPPGDPDRGRAIFRSAGAPRHRRKKWSAAGRFFFVHNRVESIYSIADLVKKLVPKARVVVGHGQMGEHELEKVMLKFVRDEADVLVCTTIVENGLDIPRANTILINRADRFGLSELYQLRGRVGRSNQRAYAYLLVPPKRCR